MADRFSEDDARRIFARAAERQGTGDAPDDGLSLDELEAIGEASGIAPEHVAAAAVELRAGTEAPRTGGFLGLPTSKREARVLPVELSDEAWERIVDDLRTTFRETGVASGIGRTREWTDGRLSGRDGIHVTARPLAGGRTELVAEHSLDTNVRSLRVITAVLGVLVVVLTVLGIVAAKPGSWLFGPLMALFLAFALAIPLWMMRRNALRAGRAFGPLLDRAELAARDTAAPLGDPSADARLAPSTLQIDLPDDNLPTDDAPHRRTRRRSR